MKKYLIGMTILSVIIFTGCKNNADDMKAKDDSGNRKIELMYDFKDSSEEFITNQARVPSDIDIEDYEINYEYEEIPDGGKDSMGLMLEGNNKSGNIFMYVFKEINEDDKLKKGNLYNVELSFDMYTDVTDSKISDKLNVKAGIVNELPVPSDENGINVLNVDLGEISGSSDEIKNLGKLKKTGNNKGFAKTNFNYETSVETSKEGRLYALIGVDSDYNGKIKMYIDNVNIKLSEDETTEK